MTTSVLSCQNISTISVDETNNSRPHQSLNCWRIGQQVFTFISPLVLPNLAVASQDIECNGVDQPKSTLSVELNNTEQSLSNLSVRVTSANNNCPFDTGDRPHLGSPESESTTTTDTTTTTACFEIAQIESSDCSEAALEGGRGEASFLRDYQFMQKLGAGMIGRVYLVTHIPRNELMAMKIMPKQKVVQLGQVAHVKNERNILSSGIQHPFIVSLFTTFTDDDFLYIVLEYLPGKELYYYIRQMRRFPVETARFYATQAISAIGYLHSMSIIYRDLKPENAMLDKHGNLKLVDFGFSKRVVHSTWTLKWSLIGINNFITSANFVRDSLPITNKDSTTPK